ncbi:hypothetical protein [Nocardioides litoris]|uniref:hypothetical protein n=1 Tax=Nocardioides litoris TaxID=1926648 RepID=UPI0011235087|nr:hypothetical protein [Nocardioides litoris]
MSTRLATTQQHLVLGATALSLGAATAEPAAYGAGALALLVAAARAGVRRRQAGSAQTGSARTSVSWMYATHS